MNQSFLDYAPSSPRANPNTVKKVEAFVEYVHSSPKISLTMEECAQKVFVCPRRLGQICREILGKSPQQVRTEAVIREAQRLLIETDNTVCEVSDFLDFNDSTNFSKFFRKHTGYSPTKFRGWK